MDFENNSLNKYRLQYQFSHPNYLSDRLTTEIESRGGGGGGGGGVVLTSTNQTYNSIDSFCVWISILVIFYWALSEIVRELGSEKVSKISIFRLSRSRCINCKFYNSNLYLKCAVQPNIVRTTQARNCIDYSKQ